MTLDRLALSRATVDRAGELRSEADLLDRLLGDPSTRVLLLDGDLAPVTGGAVPTLALTDPATALALQEKAWAPDARVLRLYLGHDEAGSEGPSGGPGPHYVALARLEPPLKGSGLPRAQAGPAPQPEPALPGTRWASLREVGTLLDDTAAGLLTTAVAMAHWHAGHAHCSRCGTATDVIQSGWARLCPHCGAEHYPRTDGAVIMAITDADDRILLGRHVNWPPRRFSCLAGFVEPGESLEAAVRREVREEAGVVVGEVGYRGSQPWPFPASLMLGFRGRALSTGITVDGVELESARWWTREELALDVATGELLLPPVVSIARRLVEDWYGGPLSDADAEPWR